MSVTVDHIAAAQRELDALGAAVAAGPVDATVPTCPDWSVADLVAHVGLFCAFWAHVLCEGTGRPKPVVPDPPSGDAVAAWFAEVAPLLMAELRATPPGTDVWTWYPGDHTAAFVARRAANELAVHRYDAQSARGTCEPIDAPLAADGIDELFGRLVLARARTGRATGQTLHVHGTDDGVTAEWLVTLQPDAVEVRSEHGKGDLALHGTASDLELLLYNRPTLGAVERFGDSSVLDAWYDEFIF